MQTQHTPSQVLGFAMQTADAQYISRAAKRIDAQEMLFTTKACIPTPAQVYHMATWEPAKLDSILDALIDYAKPQTKRALRAIVKRTIVLK